MVFLNKFFTQINRRVCWIKIVGIFVLTFGVVFGGMVVIDKIFLKGNGSVSVASNGGISIEDKKSKAEKESGKDESITEKRKQEIEKREAERRVAEKKKAEEEAKIKQSERERELYEIDRIKARKRVENIKDGGKRIIALTFDDGPSGVTTPRLLQILREKKVRATFFVLGNMVRNNKEIVKQEEADGHEVQGHTMTHRAFNTMNEEEMNREIWLADTLMREVTGKAPSIVRPPYGVINELARKVVKRPFVYWNVDTLDWKFRDVSSVRKRAVSGAHNGAIILMHDIHATTVNAVPYIIDDLKSLGYEFVTVSEMAMVRGVNLEPGKDYWGI